MEPRTSFLPGAWPCLGLECENPSFAVPNRTPHKCSLGSFWFRAGVRLGGRTQPPCTWTDKIALLNRKELDAKCGFLPSHGGGTVRGGGIKIP